MFIFLTAYQINLVFSIISKNLFVRLIFIEYLCARHYTGCSIHIAKQTNKMKQTKINNNKNQSQLEDGPGEGTRRSSSHIILPSAKGNPGNNNNLIIKLTVTQLLLRARHCYMHFTYLLQILHFYWAGQKVRSGSPVTSYRKT